MVYRFTTWDLWANRNALELLKKRKTPSKKLGSKSGARAPVGPRCERQQRNSDHVEDNRRDRHAQATMLSRRIVRIRKSHDAALASCAITVNYVTSSGFVGRQQWTKRACLQSYGVILSEAKNLRSNSGSAYNENGPGMFRSAQHDSGM